MYIYIFLVLSTGEKPFSCTMCHFMTKHRKNLRLHVQCRHPEAFEEWSVAHPEEPARRRRRPFFTLQQIEELKQQYDNSPGIPRTIVSLIYTSYCAPSPKLDLFVAFCGILILLYKVTVDSATLQAMQGVENASVSQDTLGNTTIIYEQGWHCP